LKQLCSSSSATPPRPNNASALKQKIKKKQKIKRQIILGQHFDSSNFFGGQAIDSLPSSTREEQNEMEAPAVAAARALDKVGGDVDGNSELERTVDDGQQDHQTPEGGGTTAVSPWGRLVPVGGSTGRGSHATGMEVVELAPDQPPLLLGRSPDCDPRYRLLPSQTRLLFVC
jgi:hypothetical protein